MLLFTFPVSSLRTLIRLETIDMRISRWSTYLSVFLAFFGISYAGVAAAYLGPGAGLGMIGSLIAVLFVVLVIVLGLVIYPIKLLRKKRLARGAPPEDSGQ